MRGVVPNSFLADRGVYRVLFWQKNLTKCNRISDASTAEEAKIAREKKENTEEEMEAFSELIYQFTTWKTL